MSYSAYQHLIEQFKRGGITQVVERMDNKVSQLFKSFLQTQGIELKLTPAHVHRRDSAERAIRTWKNHFLAGLASLNPKFPIRFWSHLLLQSEITLNLLRQSRLNPRLLAYSQRFGAFDYYKTPLAPPGCEIIAFTPPSQRTTWGYHGQKAWYVGPAMHHYRCIQAINENTGRESTVETVQFLPHNFSMPALSSHDLAIKTAHDLTVALKKPHPAAPFLPANTEQVASLKQLATIFAEMANPKRGDAIHAPLPRVPLLAVPTTTPVAHFTRDVQLHEVVLPVPTPNLQMANAVFDPDTGQNLEYRQLIRHPAYRDTWTGSASNEFGRLAQGIRDIAGTNTIRFIH